MATVEAEACEPLQEALLGFLFDAQENYIGPDPAAQQEQKLCRAPRCAPQSFTRTMSRLPRGARSGRPPKPS